MSVTPACTSSSVVPVGKNAPSSHTSASSSDDLKSLHAWDSTSTLVVTATQKPPRTNKDFAKAFGELQTNQGLSGAPIVASPAKKNLGIIPFLKRDSTLAASSHNSSTPLASVGKDFATAFGTLQANYGTTGAPVVVRADRVK
jgi:ABC-type phosphate/phosphonate transport system substrate-binding protein